MQDRKACGGVELQLRSSMNLGSNLEVSGQLHRPGGFTPAALRIGGWVGLTVRLLPLLEISALLLCHSIKQTCQFFSLP